MIDKSKIIIVDDHKLFRNGLRFILDQIHGIEVIAEADNGRQFLEILESNKPGISREVARNVDCPIHILEELENNSSIVVLHELAKNLKTPDETLRSLSKHTDMLVRDYARRTLMKKGFVNETN